MKCFIYSVVLSVCLKLTLCVTDTYKAAVVDSPKNVDLGRYVSFIQGAAKSNADILVLATPEEPNYGEEYYDEAVKTISEAAKENEIYVVAHLYEKTLCQSKSELVRNNLVFDTRGAVVSVYRKPLNKMANCTGSSAEATEFTTTFGVTFGLMMEEDLVLRRPKSLKNYIVAGVWRSEIPFLNAAQFSSSWAFVRNANLISSGGIYAGKSGLKSGWGNMSVVELQKNGDSGDIIAPVVLPPKLYPSEDLNPYTIRPLNVESSLRGYTETVCHDEFCCEFYIKTDFAGRAPAEVRPGLAAFAGARHFGGQRHIGAQSCAVFACTGLHESDCLIGLKTNSTHMNFEKIIITGNFTDPNKSQFPIILSSTNNPIMKFKFNLETLQKSQKVTIEASNCNILTFGIFARDFSKDYESDNDRQVNSEGLTLDVYGYLYNEDVQEFFDYVWIRLRIMLVVVSIYVLEML